MAYDDALAQKVRGLLARRQNIVEKKMFGGLAFMHRGNMCCGVSKDELIVRLGEAGAAEALQEPHTREMDFTGKPMKTMAIVRAEGLTDVASIRGWILRTLDFTKTLPAK